MGARDAGGAVYGNMGDGTSEVDYVLRHQGELLACEVKSGANQGNIRGLDAFCKRYPACRPLVLGTGGLPLQRWFENG